MEGILNPNLIIKYLDLNDKLECTYGNEILKINLNENVYKLLKDEMKNLIFIDFPPIVFLEKVLATLNKLCGCNVFYTYFNYPVQSLKSRLEKVSQLCIKLSDESKIILKNQLLQLEGGIRTNEILNLLNATGEGSAVKKGTSVANTKIVKKTVITEEIKQWIGILNICNICNK